MQKRKRSLQEERPGRTRRSRNAAEMSGDGEDDGEQHPQRGGAKAEPQDGPPGLERRHGTAAVTRPETNAIGGGLHSTGVGTLEKCGKRRRKKKTA